ncbi:MAG: hypothetical protein E6I21_11605 [Chloroflexi bacterium]|nr:MAG: hypothetical protein E6I21_11605 [Chloroflexota bacterium]
MLAVSRPVTSTEISGRLRMYVPKAGNDATTSVPIRSLISLTRRSENGLLIWIVSRPAPGPSASRTIAAGTRSGWVGADTAGVEAVVNGTICAADPTAIVTAETTATHQVSEPRRISKAFICGSLTWRWAPLAADPACF